MKAARGSGRASSVVLGLSQQAEHHQAHSHLLALRHSKLRRRRHEAASLTPGRCKGQGNFPLPSRSEEVVTSVDRQSRFCADCTVHVYYMYMYM